jgi:hypothetical protein
MNKWIAGFVLVAVVLGSVPVSAKHRRATSATASHHHRHQHVSRLPPHQQPRRANNPDTGIGPTAGEQAVDRKIKNICRGC